MTVSDQGSLLKDMNSQCHNKMSSLCGILQARMLEWVAIPFFRGSSQPRDRTQVSCIAGGFLRSEPPGKPQNAFQVWHTHFSSRPTVLVGFIYTRALHPHGAEGINLSDVPFVASSSFHTHTSWLPFCFFGVVLHWPFWITHFDPLHVFYCLIYKFSILRAEAVHTQAGNCPGYTARAVLLAAFVPFWSINTCAVSVTKCFECQSLPV